MGDSGAGRPQGRCRRAVSQQGWHCHCSSLCLNGALSSSFTTGSCCSKSQKPALYPKLKLGWERLLRLSPAVNVTLPSPPINQVPNCCTYMSFFNTSKIFDKPKKLSFALSTDRARGKVLRPLLFPCPVPACCPSKSWGALCITTLSCREIFHSTLLYSFKRHSLLSFLIPLSFLSGKLGKCELGDACMWKGIAAWAKTWDLNTQLCPNCIESETWPVTAGQVTRNSFSFGFWLYHNTHSKQQQKLRFHSWKDFSLLKKHQGNFLVMLVEPKCN